MIRAACRKLDTEPSSVEQFVEHLTFLARLETEMVTLEKEFVIVNRFVHFMSWVFWTTIEPSGIEVTIEQAIEIGQVGLMFTVYNPTDHHSRLEYRLSQYYSRFPFYKKAYCPSFFYFYNQILIELLNDDIF